MYTLYSLLLTVGFVILLPRFAIDALRSGKYVTGLKERLGNLSPAKSKNPVIWLHCVSVGEAQAAQSLVQALGQKFPRYDLVISTTTVTGQKMARALFGEQAAAIFYFPIDWAWTVRRAMRVIQPSAVIVMETEVWPRLFRECSKAGIPVALLNGRLSEKSFRRYRLVRSFISRVLNDLTFAAVQTIEDADRFRELGLAKERIKVFGNLKFDSASIFTSNELKEEIRRRFAFERRRPLIVAASTHAPEETIVLQAFKQTRHSHPAARLLFAPRHPERFDEVAALLEGSGFTVGRRSAPQSDSDAQCDIVLLDTIGELRAVYPLAQIVFMGGSLIPHGGQNVIEPAAHGVCTITGPHTQNFAAVTKAMLDEDALIQLPSTSDSANGLAWVLTQLLSDEKRRHEIGERAKAVCRRNQGATERSIELISQILSAPAKGDREIHFSTLHVTAAK
jgi:3-deoxy-D-manno-octulosonic-acid transferase